MKIVASEDVLYAQEAFSTLGTVELAPARNITRELLADAGMLIVRSTTRVDAALLAGSRVRFVGSAVAGTDHLDTEWMERQGIAWASAAGCNANSVAEYLTAALLVMASRIGCDLAGKSIGVIGVGNVGSRVVAKARALGMTVIQNDPPLARETGEARFRPIEEALEADFVTLHVPLTREGPDATHHMIGRDRLRRMRQGAVLINASRGPVVEPDAAVEARADGHLGGLVLDVYEGEPAVSPQHVEAADIATPHIAGHSLDGKVAGTAIVYEAACRLLDRQPTVDLYGLMPVPPVPHLTVSADGEVEEIVRRTVLKVYDIEADDARLREALKAHPEGAAEAFQALRKHYPTRREFPGTRVEFERCPERARRVLLGLGFTEARQ